MILTTTPSIEGKKITEYLGVVTAEAILGANFVKDIFAGFSDFFGGRSKTYEAELKKAREAALAELEEVARQKGADAVVGIDLDFEVVGAKGSMLMVNVSGTAVKLG
jgi:uncharacterized protein YbjQ (UPF0145 family)